MTSGLEMGRWPEKSSFSLACRLLSQFVKDKGCPSDLGLGMASRYLDSVPSGKSEGYRPPTTMSLLPGVDVSGDDNAELSPHHACSDFSAPPANSKPAEKAQLTIFYGGKVLVFDDFPAEKAIDLIHLAGQKPQPSSLSADHLSCLPASFPPPPPQPNFSDLPIARRASLHRFLEKRKDRINAKTPYPVSGNEGSKINSRD